KAKSVNKIFTGPIPNKCKNLFTKPSLPKMPINAYALSSKLIHVGKMINNSHSCWFFILIKKYAAGYEITNVNKVIKNAYQNELSIIFKKVPFLKNST